MMLTRNVYTKNVVNVYKRFLLMSTVATTVLFLPEFFSFNTIIHKPLQLYWRNFARTCTLTTARTVLNFKVKGQGHNGFWFICVHDAAATKRQYLALSKVW